MLHAGGQRKTVWARGQRLGWQSGFGLELLSCKAVTLVNESGWFFDGPVPPHGRRFVAELSWAVRVSLMPQPQKFSHDDGTDAAHPHVVPLSPHRHQPRFQALSFGPQTPPRRPSRPLSNGATVPRTATRPGAAPRAFPAFCARRYLARCSDRAGREIWLLSLDRCTAVPGCALSGPGSARSGAET